MNDSHVFLPSVGVVDGIFVGDTEGCAVGDLEGD